MPNDGTNPETKLGRMELKSTSIAVPKPVLEHLEKLTERAAVANATKRDVIAALIASCDLGEDSMVALVMTYRKAHADDLPISPPQSAES